MRQNQIKRIVCGALAAVLTAGMLAGCGSKKDNKDNGMGKSLNSDSTFGTPSAFGTIEFNDEKVPLGKPETTVDVQKLYSSITYTPEMFCGEYRLYGESSKFDHSLRDRMCEKVTHIDIANRSTDAAYLEAHPTVTVSDLPLKFQCMEGMYIESNLIRTFGTFFA